MYFIYHKRMVLKTLTWIAIPSKHTARNWYGENLSNLGNVSLTIWIKKPILRMYKLIKTNFSMEHYLNLIKEAKYRRSLTKLRLSSHNLEIERGRHTKPVTPVIERLCIVCVVDDELHFVTSCKKHTTERERLYSYVDSHVPNFCNLNNAERFIYLLTNENPSIFLHLSKFATDVS